MIKIVLLFVAILLSANLMAMEIRSAPFGPCSLGAHSKKIILKSTIVLNKDFMGHHETPEAYEQFIGQSIEKQILHLLGFFKNNPQLKISLLSFRGNVTKTIEEKDYGEDLVIDAYLPKEREKDTDVYTKNALAAGKVSKKDKALLIHYQSPLIITNCGGKDLKDVNVSLPRDPYLSLWIQRKEERVQKSFGPFSLPSMSECQSRELTVFGGPNESWYFWGPIRPDGKTCVKSDDEKIITPIFTEESSLPGMVPFREDFFNDKKVSFHLVFGEVSESDYYTPKNLAHIKGMVQKNLKQCLRGPCLDLWTPSLVPQKDGKYFEPGAHSFLLFLKHMNHSVALSSFKLNENEKEIEIELSGKLRSSKRPIQMRIFFGNTQLERVTRSYLTFIHRAYKEADMISYVGHAGLGRNQKIAQLMAEWKKIGLPEIQREHPLWLGLYNCGAASYFGFDLDNIFKPSKLNVIETFTSGNNSGAEFPLMHLSALSEVTSKKSADLRRHVKLNQNYPEEFVIYNWIKE